MKPLIPKRMRSFLNYVQFPNTEFKARSTIHRFRKMVFAFDHSENYYSPARAEEGLNRHRRASHVTQALERLDIGRATAGVSKMSKTFTSFRHKTDCAVTDRCRDFSPRHAQRKSEMEDTSRHTFYQTNSWR